MTDGRDPASMIEAAQRAVGDGDYLAAERLLREAVTIQEASLGSSHPDLASTLNNLAFVHERTGNVDEAERGYRRAHKIAVASLSPGHPFIKTSLSNLVEFCASRGIPIWTPPAAPIEDEPLPDDMDAEPLPEDADVEPVIEAAPDVVHEPIAASRLPLRMMAGAALVIATILGIVFARQGQGTTDVSQPVAEAQTETVPPAPVAPAPSASEDHSTRSSARAGTDSHDQASPRAGRDECVRHCAHGAVVQCAGEERVTRLAMHAGERRPSAGHVHVLHAAADGRRDHGRTSLVLSRPRASDDAVARGCESGQWLSHVQCDHREPGARRRLEGRVAGGRWKPAAGRAIRRPLTQVYRSCSGVTRTPPCHQALDDRPVTPERRRLPYRRGSAGRRESGRSTTRSDRG